MSGETEIAVTMFAFAAGSGRVLGLAGNKRATASFKRHLHVVTIEAPCAVRGAAAKLELVGLQVAANLRFVSESQPSSPW